MTKDIKQLELILADAVDYFREEYINKLPAKVDYEVQRADGLKRGTVTRSALNQKFTSLVGNKPDIFKNKFIDHLHALEAFLAYSSSPTAFAQAWKFRKTKISKLSLFEVQELLSRHAQLIPTIRAENLLNCGEKGMIKSTKNQSFLMGIRHSKGNYDDNLDNLGHFDYQPPADALGMLRYRWLEVLALKFNLPIYMFVTMWFKYEAIKTTKHVTLICPVKITKRNNKFDAPLNLQLIDVHEGIERAMMIRSLDELEIQTSVRSSLNDEMVIKFNFDNINSNKALRSSLIQWAMKQGKTCPGSKCNHVAFRDVKNKSHIHLGHIIPQKWAGVFQFMQERNHIHHPDNLYLSCNTCNTSLNYLFPDRVLMDNILDGKFGTIGDFIRSDPSYFSKIEEA
ncbi:MAG TPA: hypothetical protein VNJ08_08815 [Bacteriovoracaceae bacterium]|nr:hypothetical protein [Bacteriovoracaceae bacterium]